MVMVPPMNGYLEAPWGLAEGRDELLQGFVEEEDWASVVTMLRDEVLPTTASWKQLTLLAHARFSDAATVMVDELGAASREALGLLEQAAERGAPIEQTEALRDQVETALDRVTRVEEKLRAKLQQGLDGLSNDELENLAFVLDRDEPAQAVPLFRALAAREQGPLRHAFEARAALALVHAGQFDAAKPGLEAALEHDWTQRPLSTERLTLEAVETELLMHAPRAEFEAQWVVAAERGKALDFPFPSAWPHQDRLLERALTVGDTARARHLAQRIDAERPVLPRRLREAFAGLRKLAVPSALS